MKLLIVDDEELTRTGLISAIDWKSLGIDQIIQADDGIHGLEQARLYKPEIILCDVRMPRMNGITMLERLEKLLPDSVPVFMSGYSDKEYLKAAIRLKAVSYIEKPLNPSEVSQAVREAADLYIQKRHSRRGEVLKSMETASRLALLLTLPVLPDIQTARRLFGELGFTVNSSTFFISFIIRMNTFPELSALEMFYQELSDFLEKRKINFIYTDKKHQNLLCFLFGQTEPSIRCFHEISDFICQRLSVLGRFSIAAGETVYGMAKAYQSYASAVILLQSSFFFPENTLLTPDRLNQSTKSSPELVSASPESEFADSLSSGLPESAFVLLDQLQEYFTENTKVFQNAVKDLYYKLFLTLDKARKQNLQTDDVYAEPIAEIIDRCFTFSELHQTLCRQTEDFLEHAGNQTHENPTIHMIKSYIGKHYMDETLSVKDISEHVFLSASYVCTFFKNETGHTLNQYLTEYRMEKAKQLLKDSRYRISDISSRVGYSDGNYFGKSFRKYSGLSPSEYREKNLK